MVLQIRLIFFLATIFLMSRGQTLVYPPSFSANPESSDTTWVVGSLELIDWSTIDLPPALKGTNAKLSLLSDSLTTVLADSVSLDDGQVLLNVPDVAPKDNYVLQLNDKDGNLLTTSQKFSLFKRP